MARRAGVTKAAVSFALNNQPGVSHATRERILAIALEMGFQPSSAARALSDGRTGAFGLIIDRPARMLAGEPFFMQLISGVQAGLASDRMDLVLTVAEDQDAEIEMYRTWWAQRRVDGVLLVDLQIDDRRVSVLEELNMPAVVIGTPRGAGSFPAVWQDDRAATSTVITYLAGLGHQRIARVGGIARYWHSRIRDEVLREVARSAGLDAVSVEADYTRERGAGETRRLLGGATRPTAILYDNDVMAAAGLLEAHHMGIHVPSELSILAWDDSLLCEMVHPALTALHRDIAGAGARAAHGLVELAAGRRVGHVQENTPVLNVRGSTASPGSLGSSGTKKTTQ